MIKTCNKCKQELPVENFYIRDHGYEYSCKKCKREYQRKRKNIKAKYDEEYYRVNQTTIRANKKIAYSSEQRKDYGLRTRYGISLEEARELLIKQNNKCQICGDDITLDNRFCHVDHCHKTGEIRGLLCSLCNIGLGSFKDNPEILNKAALYLHKLLEED